MSGTTELKELFFKSIFEKSSESMVLISEKGEIKLVNNNFLKLLGYEKEEIADKNFNHLLLEKDHAFFLKFLENVKKSETVKNFKFYLLTASRSIVRLFISADVLKDEKGKVGGFYLSISHVQPDDWSSLKDPYVFQSVAKKLGKLTSVGQLTSVFAHDIKNPLHVILSTSELMHGENTNEKLKASIELISRNARRASRIVKTLLDFSRSGMCQLRPYSLNDIVDCVTELFESSLKNSRIQMEKNLGNIPKVFLDSNYLNSVVYNLILNSVEALGDKGGKIVISTALCGGKVCLKITDNGKGIDKNMMKNLFRPFFTTKESGTGLGLYLAKQIINEHNGKIEIDSRPYKGTTVTLTFSEMV